jgi:hypothetical protein
VVVSYLPYKMCLVLRSIVMVIWIVAWYCAALVCDVDPFVYGQDRVWLGSRVDCLGVEMEDAWCKDWGTDYTR